MVNFYGEIFKLNKITDASSDKKIEKIILEKSKTCIKNGVVNHENPNKT